MKKIRDSRLHRTAVLVSGMQVVWSNCIKNNIKMGSAVSRIDNKRQRINGNGSIKRNQSNIRSKILRILVNSSYVGVHDLGRLVQLSKSMKIAIYKDKNLFAVAFQHTYDIPRSI